MELDHDNRIIYIHQSDLNSLRLCPELVRAKVNGELLDPDSDSAAIGTAMHSFIEMACNFRIKTGEWPDEAGLQGFVGLVQGIFTQGYPLMWKRPHQVESLEKALEYIDMACVNWWINSRPSLDHLDPANWRLEHNFDFPIGQAGDGHPDLIYDVHFRGEIDFLDHEVGMIRDWKTSVETSRQQLWKLKRYDIQSTVYAAGAAHEFGKPFTFEYHHMPRGRTWDNTYTRRDTGEEVFNGWTMHELSPSAERIQAVILEALKWAEHVLLVGTEEHWPINPSDWWCSARWCELHARGECIGAVNPVNGDEAHQFLQLIDKPKLRAVK